MNELIPFNPYMINQEYEIFEKFLACEMPDYLI